LAEAQAHTSPAFSASVLLIAFPGGAGTASLVQLARCCSSPFACAGGGDGSATALLAGAPRRLRGIRRQVFFMGATCWFGLGSGRPVLHVQARHLGKLAGVVGDQRCLLAESVGGDHGVKRANRSAAAFQFCP